MTEISNWKKVDSDNVKIDDLTLSAPHGNYWQKMMGAIARKFEAVDNKLAKVEGALVRKGEKADTSALPATGNRVGDYWTVTADGSEWAWNGSEWYELGRDALANMVAGISTSVTALNNAVALLFYTFIQAETLTTSDVPDAFAEAVQALLDANSET